MRKSGKNLAQHLQVVENASSLKVCKTFIHRFDSDPRLQLKQLKNQSLPVVIPPFFNPPESPQKYAKTANARRSASESLARSLAQSLARTRRAA